METKYVIYELVQPESLKTVKPDGYYSRTNYCDVLERIYDVDYRFNDEHKSMQSAVEHINEFKKELAGKKLTILPIINVPYYFEDNE